MEIKRRPLSDAEKEYILAHYQTITPTKMATALKRKASKAIYNFLNKEGLQPFTTRRDYDHSRIMPEPTREGFFNPGNINWLTGLPDARMDF